MSRILERLALLTGRGPRNNSRFVADRFVLEDLLIAMGWIGKNHITSGILAKYTGEGFPPALLSAMKHRWGMHAKRLKLNDGQFESLCRVAITEHFDPVICPTCKGVGEKARWHKGRFKPLPCPNCNGSGHKPFSTRAKSKALGIHKNTWKARNIDVIYGRMLGTLSSWESMCSRKMSALIDGHKQESRYVTTITEQQIIR